MPPIDLSPRQHDKKVKTSVSLPDTVFLRAHEIARRHGLSVSEYLTRLLVSDIEDRDRLARAK
jgi:macrodomain Ter protein organizer (MatP/YcbG family)